MSITQARALVAREQVATFDDPVYRARRNKFAAAALAWKPGLPVPHIEYTEAEQHVWQTVCRELFPRYERYAIAEFREGVERLGLPHDHVPNLDDLSARLEPLTGFRYVPAAGLVEAREFYGPLRERVFQATQYVRHPDIALYTPEPDIIHEVIGHGHLLATPTFSELHRLAGEATHRLLDEDNLEFLSKVFWFSLEFGVVIEDGSPRAYGAGLLSSYGEIEEFLGVEHRPLEIMKMGSSAFDIAAYQPILYRADSLDEVREVVGGFFATCTDESIAELRADAAAHASRRVGRHRMTHQLSGADRHRRSAVPPVLVDGTPRWPHGDRDERTPRHHCGNPHPRQHDRP